MSIVQTLIGCISSAGGSTPPGVLANVFYQIYTTAPGTYINRIGDATLIGSSGMTNIQDGNVDDGNTLINLPFSIFFDGVEYSSVYVGSNSYLTFGGGSSAYSGLSPSNPNLPKIMISAADNSYQRLYTLQTNEAPYRAFRIRYEGTDSTNGTPGDPTIVWEIIFFEAYQNYYELNIGVNARDSGGISGVFTSDTQIGTFN